MNHSNTEVRFKNLQTGSTGNKKEKNSAQSICPVCGAPLIQEKCKVVCRSEKCLYRIIYNCSEF